MKAARKRQLTCDAGPASSDMGMPLSHAAVLVLAETEAGLERPSQVLGPDAKRQAVGGQAEVRSWGLDRGLRQETLRKLEGRQRQCAASRMAASQGSQPEAGRFRPA